MLCICHVVAVYSQAGVIDSQCVRYFQVVSAVHFQFSAVDGKKKVLKWCLLMVLGAKVS